ncbi:hypothetical protein V1525DRAFT_258637 [Lipomyces kononenkoae]|uniref:Uncharacterized protein n=1 Tax=Lipomyces kononenkoae TaxID=34357 RepID=A0ACC3SVH0_LIPKO
MHFKNGFVASLGVALIIANACLCVAAEPKLCLVKLSGILGVLLPTTTDYWMLLEDNVLLPVETPFYDTNVVGISQFVNVTVQSQLSSESALLYVYNNDARLGANIAFVKYNDRGYHFTTNEQYLGPISIGLNDLLLTVSSAFCMDYSYDWSYSPSNKVISPSGETLISL